MKFAPGDSLINSSISGADITLSKSLVLLWLENRPDHMWLIAQAEGLLAKVSLAISKADLESDCDLEQMKVEWKIIGPHLYDKLQKSKSSTLGSSELYAHIAIIAAELVIRCQTLELNGIEVLKTVKTA